MKKLLKFLAVFSFLFLMGGCEENNIFSSITIPNVRINYRESLASDNLVPIIINSGKETIYNVCVSVEGNNTKYMVANALRSGESVEAEWIELESELQYNDIIQVYADDYSQPYEAKI